MDAKLAEARDTSARLLAELPETADGLAGWFAGADLDRRRAFLKLALHRVEVRSPGKGRKLDPLTHLNPIWRA